MHNNSEGHNSHVCNPLLLTESRANISPFPSSQKIQCQIFSGEHISKFTKKNLNILYLYSTGQKPFLQFICQQRGVLKVWLSRKTNQNKTVVNYEPFCDNSIWVTFGACDALYFFHTQAYSKSFDNICVDEVKRCFFNNYVSTSTFQSRFYLLRHKSDDIGSQMLLRVFMEFLFFHACTYKFCIS